MRSSSAAPKWVLGLSLVLLPVCGGLTYWQARQAIQHGGLLGHLTHPSFWLIATALGTLLTAGLLWGAAEAWLHQPSTRHGSAHWAWGRELKTYTVKRREGGLVLGQRGWRLIGVGERRLHEHVAIVGTTGKGKTSLVVVPALLRERGRHSLFILDAKSDLFPLTAGALAEHHNSGALHRGNPRRVTATTRWRISPPSRTRWTSPAAGCRTRGRARMPSGRILRSN